MVVLLTAPDNQYYSTLVHLHMQFTFISNFFFMDILFLLHSNKQKVTSLLLRFFQDKKWHYSHNWDLEHVLLHLYSVPLNEPTNLI